MSVHQQLDANDWHLLFLTISRGLVNGVQGINMDNDNLPYQGLSSTLYLGMDCENRSYSEGNVTNE